MPATSPTKSTVSSPTSPYPDGEPAPRPPPLYSDGTKIPLIVCGDYNSVPDSGLYEFLSNGTLPPDHSDFMSHSYGKYTSEGLRHKFGLKSAFAGIGELSMTNFTPTFKGAIDYIWYSTPNLAVNAVLGDVDKVYLEKAVGFPNAHFPSEYVLSCHCIIVIYANEYCFYVATSLYLESSASNHPEKHHPDHPFPSSRLHTKRVSSLSHSRPSSPF
jgi:CCR4-NOT transcription complex subunit 6